MQVQVRFHQALSRKLLPTRDKAVKHHQLHQSALNPSSKTIYYLYITSTRLGQIHIQLRFDICTLSGLAGLAISVVISYPTTCWLSP